MSPQKKRHIPAIDTSTAKNTPCGALIESESGLERLNDEPQKSAHVQRSLHIRGLPKSTTSEDLKIHFSQSFPVRHATAVLDPETGESRGYGFVTFVEAEDARITKDELDGSEFGGSKIKITFAKVRQRGEKNDSETDAKGQKRKRDGEITQNGTAAPIQPSRLIVRNLPWDVRESEELAVLFRSYGKIKAITIPRREGGSMSGFAFVTMRGRKNAAKAMEGVNGKDLHGRTLAVDWAIDRERWQELNKKAFDQDKKPLTNLSDGIEDDKHTRGLSDELTLEREESSGASDEFSEQSVSEARIENDDAPRSDGPSESKLISSSENNESTMFIRNLPFGCLDDDLHDHFSRFGRLRYARVVVDPTTGQSKGTGFVCFRNMSDARSCLLAAPKMRKQERDGSSNHSNGIPTSSVIQDDSIDTDGRFTLEGRVLQVSQAVGRTEAAQLRDKGIEFRRHRERDKRHLYLLNEGTIPSSAPLHQKLSTSEIAMRESSAKQRKALVDKNPALHLSLVRLSVRNMPRHVTSKDLKTLARDAVVGFATDVKQGTRQPLSKEELGRAADDMRENEKLRKSKGKGLVKQAKIVYEGREGGKVREETGGGRSRGYGFIEYYTHRSALMGLRWLNGHAVSQPVARQEAQRQGKSSNEERTRRLIIEFAIENAQVVRNRKIRETRPAAKYNSNTTNSDGRKFGRVMSNGNASKKEDDAKINQDELTNGSSGSGKKRKDENDEADKLVKRQKIIARKRMARRVKKRAATS